MFRKEAEKSFRSGYLLVKSIQNQPGLLFNITMKQHSIPSESLLKCQFEKDSQNVLFSDLKKNLIKLNLNNLHYSTILTDKQIIYYEGYDRDKIYVASSENQSKLYLVNTINKRWEKFNLNINKIIAFEINLIRNLILVADPVIMNIFDQRTKADTLTYKPPKQQRILKAIFSANNRSVIVLTSGMIIRQLSLYNLEQQFESYLPIAIQEPHMVVSGNNKHLALTGSSHQLTLMSGFNENASQFTVLGFPFRIKSTKFDINNNLVILGKDQIIYYYIVQQNRLVRLFNYNNKDVINNFDVSLDNQYICCISNFGTIFVYALKDTLDVWRQKKQLFEEKSVIVISQYVPEVQQQLEEGEEENDQDSFEQYLQQIPSQSFHFGEGAQQDFPDEALKDPRIGHSFGALKYKLNQNDFFKENGQEIVQIIYAFNKLIQKDQYSVTYYFLSLIIQSQTLINQLSLILCPQLISIIQKRFNLNFQDFVVKSLTSLFLNYFDQNNWINIIKFLIKNKATPQVLLVFFLNFLKSIQATIKKCKQVEDFQNALKSKASSSLNDLFQKSIQVSLNKKYKFLFKKIQVQNHDIDQPIESSKRSIDESKNRIKQLNTKKRKIQSNISDLYGKKQRICD